MSQPYLGEIRIVSFDFPPRGWAFCNGQLLPINQNQALFSVLGTAYGGNGTVNFALPNLVGRVPVHTGQGIPFAGKGGELSHTLTINELPAHTHPARAQSSASSPGISPAGAIWAASTQTQYAASADTTMSTATVSAVGGGQPHENLPPYLALSFVIALQGIFPSPS